MDSLEFMAAQNGHDAIVEVLIKHGANIHQARSDLGDTPLIIASVSARTNIVGLLLSHGASLHGTNIMGSTCFTCALDPERNFNPYRKHGILYRLRKWPTTMAILVLQELDLYHLIDCSSLIDLHQYIGTELFMLDNEEDYEIVEYSDDDDDDDDFFDVDGYTAFKINMMRLRSTF